MPSTELTRPSDAAPATVPSIVERSTEAGIAPHREAAWREWISQIAPLWFARRWLAHPERLVVRRYTVPIAGLPPQFDRLRIAHVSDLHLGRCVGPDYVRAVVDLALALQPDLFALTGDFVENVNSPIGLVAELLAPLADPARSNAIGAVAVLGNHDWYAGPERVAGALRCAGLRVLDNTRVFVGSDRSLQPVCVRSDSLCLAGFGDLGHNDTKPHAALAGVAPDMCRLVLAHHPDTAEEALFTEDDQFRIDVMLSGHTHGGQIRLPWIGPPIVPSRYGRKYMGGLIHGPAFRVLVSRGAGMTMLPIRIGVPPEISEVTLVRARETAPAQIEAGAVS